VKHLFLFVLLFLSFTLSGQGFLVTTDRDFVVDRTRDTTLYGSLGKGAALEDMDDKERDYLYWVNAMRSNPPQFYKRYVEPFLQQFPEARGQEASSLRAAMSILGALPLLYPATTLNRVAESHAEYLAQAQQLSHTGQGGRSFSQRMVDAGVKTCAGEVIYSGKDDGLIAVILLLIDHQVPDLGHRKALLNPEFRNTGVGLRYMDDKTAVYVQDFSCDQ
jgi:uncharacterized protein YkwD